MKKMDVGDAEKEAMEEYTECLRECLGERRDIKKSTFKIARTIYRGVRNGRFTLEWALKRLNIEIAK